LPFGLSELLRFDKTGRENNGCYKAVTEPEDPGMTGPAVVLLVNGPPGGLMSIRAREFGDRMQKDFRVHVAHRQPNKVASIF
jgi:hypothetical protein